MWVPKIPSTRSEQPKCRSGETTEQQHSWGIHPFVGSGQRGNGGAWGACSPHSSRQTPGTAALSLWTHRLQRRSVNLLGVLSGGTYPCVAGNPEGGERGGGSCPPLRWHRARPDSPISPFLQVSVVCGCAENAPAPATREFPNLIAVASTWEWEMDLIPASSGQVRPPTNPTHTDHAPAPGPGRTHWDRGRRPERGQVGQGSGQLSVQLGPLSSVKSGGLGAVTAGCTPSRTRNISRSAAVIAQRASW